MGRIELSTTVKAPPARVFDVFSDLEKAEDRIRGITKLKILGDGTVGKGTRWRETRIMFKKEATEEMWFTEFDPPRSYTVQGDTCGCDFFTTFTFTEEGGGTRVGMEVRTQARTLMAKIMSPLGALFAGSMKKATQNDIDDLKKVAESA